MGNVGQSCYRVFYTKRPKHSGHKPNCTAALAQHGSCSVPAAVLSQYGKLPAVAMQAAATLPANDPRTSKAVVSTAAAPSAAINHPRDSQPYKQRVSTHVLTDTRSRQPSDSKEPVRSYHLLVAANSQALR